MPRLTPIITLVAAVAFAASARADTDPVTSFNSTDRVFLQHASASINYILDAARVANQHTTTPHVRSVAQRLTYDHSVIANDLATIARAQKLTFAPASEQLNMLEGLRGLHGSAFDNEYLRQQAQVERSAIDTFQHEVRHGQNLALRHLAENNLGALRQDLLFITAPNPSPGRPARTLIVPLIMHSLRHPIPRPHPLRHGQRRQVQSRRSAPRNGTASIPAARQTAASNTRHCAPIKNRPLAIAPCPP